MTGTEDTLARDPLGRRVRDNDTGQEGTVISVHSGRLDDPPGSRLIGVAFNHSDHGTFIIPPEPPDLPGATFGDLTFLD
jgi:hypothetical protein